MIEEKSENSILIALPVFNETKYVGEILGELKKYSRNILVVDDGSTDGTSEFLRSRENINIISHSANLGYGQSLIDAFGYAQAENFDWVITIDCDCQHEPVFIPTFCYETQRDDVDIISGSRYLIGNNSGPLQPPKERAAINKAITEILNQNLNLGLTDAFCGFKAYRVEALGRLRLGEAGYGFPLQLWVQAAGAGLRAREIPVPMIYHDSKRNFGGRLEDHQVRWNYYISIIERELGYDVNRNIKELVNT